MAFDIANPIGTGTDAELLAFTRAAIAQVTLHGKAYTSEGFQLTRADLPDLRKQVEWLEGRINATTPSRANKCNQIQFKRPQ